MLVSRYDGDGDSDIFYVNIDGPAVLLRNDSDKPRSDWIGVRPVPNENALVEIRPGGGAKPFVRQAWRVRGYLSASEPVVRTGAAGDVDVTVRWGKGPEVVRRGLPPGRVWRIERPALPR